MFRLCAGILALAAAWANDRESAVDAIFTQYTRPGSPGCAVGVFESGKTALAKGYGRANLDDNVALTPKSRFYMASVSKHFTSVAALLAEREGKLSLDDPLRKHVPEMPPYAASIPLRRMLDHTAGLRDYLTLWALKGWSNESVLRVGPTLALVTRQKALDFAPGSEHSYSNTGYFLMALIIQRATGQNLDAYIQERVLGPLGMAATRFQHDHADPVPDRAQGYRREADSWKTAPVGFDIVGSGGLYSNVEDMLKWARNFEEPRAAGAVLEALQQPGKLTDGRPTPGGYALGLTNDVRDGLRRISHSGGAVGYRTFFLRIPERRLSVVTLCNAGDANPEELSNRVASVYLGQEVRSRRASAPKTASRRELDAAERRRLAGTFWSEELETVWKLVERDGKLICETEGGEHPVLSSAEGYHVGPGLLTPVGNSFKVSAGRARGIVFTRR